jgi:hypothetical protein
MKITINPGDWSVFDKNTPDLWPENESFCLCYVSNELHIRQFKRNSGFPFWILNSGYTARVILGDKYIELDVTSKNS